MSDELATALAFLRDAGEDVRPCATVHLADGWRWYWRDAQQLLRDDDVIAAAGNLRELADVRGQRCRIDWLVTGYPATDRSDYGTVVGVDGIGTATIRRDDGAMIVAGAGAWVILR